MDKILDVKSTKPIYNVGDYVQIKNIEQPKSCLGGYTFSNEMCQYAGKETCITKIVFDNEEKIYIYSLEIDDGRFNWTEDMFTFNWATKSTYIVGDCVKLCKDVTLNNIDLFDDIQKYIGYPTCIREITEDGKYKLDFCDDIAFSAEMLEPIHCYEFYNREPLNDNVNHPSHYTDGKIEVIDFIVDKKLDFCLGNACKYISRAGKKDPNKTIEDLKKAIWYINKEIELLSNK